MILKLKNKDKLVVGDFIFRCAIGKNGISKNKKEGDGKSPQGKFGLGTVYWRSDRIKKPITKIKCEKIKKDIGWCDDINSKFYNKKVKLNKKFRCEKLFRKDNKYDLIIVINYNTKKIVKNKGSAIFIHLTNNYKPTAGCLAVKEKDMFIILKLINKNSKILIN